jgi:hypothetical protein
MGNADIWTLVLAAVLAVLWLWGLVDACVRPGWAFTSAGSNKTLWVVLQIVDVLYVPTLVYVLIIRSRVIAAQVTGPPPPGSEEGSGPDPGVQAQPSMASAPLHLGEPVAVAAQRVAAQRVAAQPVAAQPVAVQPVAAQPMAAPTMAAPTAGGHATGVGAAVVVQAPEPRPMAVAPDWMVDPTARHQLRYWDGWRWTEHVADQGVQGVDLLP